MLLSTFLINHFELFGLQQAWFHMRGRARRAAALPPALVLQMGRHPLYLGFFLAFWATPQMTAGPFAARAGMSVYILIAIGYEERDLVSLFGRDYERLPRQASAC